VANSTSGPLACEGAQHVGDDAVYSDALDLAGRVVVVRRAEDEQGTELGVQPGPASADEARVAVQHQHVRQPYDGPTSRKTDATKLRAAVSEVAVLKVGTSQTRPRAVRRSMCTCRKS
jgi:hypothetical protein